jgi:glycosyltransferase involved in cell wall biosynthesis
VKYLFVHQNYPGQYLHLIRHLTEDPANEVVFISEPNRNILPNVRRLLYSPPAPDQRGVHLSARDFDLACYRADAVGAICANLDRLGFRPDIVLGHHGWGELLNITDIWPNVPMLGYFEFYYEVDGQDVDFDPEFPMPRDRYPKIRSMNVVNLLAFALGKHGQTPTHWQWTRYPTWARPAIRVIREGARLDVCKPDPSARRRNFSIGDFKVTPRDKLVTYVARNLEPYRGFHVMMRALPALLAGRPDVKVIMLGGDDVSYGAKPPSGTWREKLQGELRGQYDESRVLMPGQIAYETYLALMQRSDAHAYLTYPFVASWSLREALACGCAIVASDVEPVAEFITHGDNGLLVPPLDPQALAATLLELLADDKRSKRLRASARAYAERHLDMNRTIAATMAVINELTAGTR